MNTQINEGGNGGEEDVVVEDIVETKDDKGKDTTDWKALALKNQGIAKRFQTKLEKAKNAPTPVLNKDGKPVVTTDAKPPAGELDRMDKMILRSEKITADYEVALVQEIMKETGKPLEKVLESKYFQAELKEMRELKTTEGATPTGTKRNANATRDTVDYWINKGELPPLGDPLREKVVNAKIAKEKAGSKFSANPIQ